MLAVAVWMRILEPFVLEVRASAWFGSHGFNEFLQGLSGSGQSQTGEVAGQSERARFTKSPHPHPGRDSLRGRGMNAERSRQGACPFNAISRVRNGVLDKKIEAIGQ